MTFTYKEAIVVIAANNSHDLIYFYRQLLNQCPTVDIPNIYAEFQLQGLRLGIFQPKKEHEPEFDDSRRSSISICLEVQNLNDAIAHLTKIGYPPSGKIINSSHGKEIYAYDPQGNRLIVHQSHQTD
ncbi:MAG: hypothetical protein Tsb0014_33450 [Pleurocapsa sp.]